MTPFLSLKKKKIFKTEKNLSDKSETAMNLFFFFTSRKQLLSCYSHVTVKMYFESVHSTLKSNLKLEN